MCTVGGPMNIDIPEERSIRGKKLQCNDCGEKFNGIGKKPICPSCQSDNIVKS